MREVRTLGALALAAAAAMLGAAAPAGASHTDETEALPIVFVHGGVGSAQQYASVARRFASNGYPQDRIAVYEYNSASPAAIAAAPAGVEALIEDLRDRFGVDQVNLVGHSLGTFVSNNFLANPARRALVRHYVGVDGASNTSCRDVWEPDPAEDIACMGIWAQPQGTRAVGSTNHSFAGQQTHVEAATSQESFAFQYAFFTGEQPRTTDILPEPPGQVEISGRAVNFPANAGVNGATVEIWEVNGTTGQRKYAAPLATFEIGPSGSWGQVSVSGQQHYEFVISRTEAPRQHHLYFQPFIRDDHLVRLLTSELTAPIATNTNIGPNHTTAVLVRNREWWTTHPSGRNDVLEITTTRGQTTDGPHNVFASVTANTSSACTCTTRPPGIR